MASSKASIEAGRGHVTLETRNLIQKGLDEAQSSLRAWGTSIMTMGAAIAATGLLIAAPFLKGLDAFETWGRTARTAMRETGMSFQELDLTMNGMRMTADELVPSVAKMDQFLLHALNGSQDANRVVARLGLSLTELNRANQGERMMLFADALSRVADAGERVALQREVFGRGWAAMNIEGGRAGIEQRAARTRYLQGDSMHSTEALQAARSYAEAKREFGQVMDGVWASLGMAAAPVMADFLQMITRVVVGVREWMDANRPLLTTIFYIADKLILLGTIIGFVGSAVYAASYAFAFISGAIGIVGGVISWFVSLASGGFGLLTVLSWGWGAATFAAGLVASSALFLYKTGLIALTAITWLWNVAGAGLAAVLGLFT